MPEADDIATIAEMVHSNLLGRFQDRGKVPLDLMMSEVKGTISTLGLEYAAAKVLSAMEGAGYVSRFGREFTLKAPVAEVKEYK